MPIALAVPARPRTVTTADDGWYRAIISFAQHTGWLQPAMKLYTVAGIGLLVLIAIYAWWGARSRGNRTVMAALVWLGIGSAVSVACGLALKQVFQENRPCQVIHVATVEACPGPTDYSFPSDHATVAFALAAGLWIVARKLGVIAVILATVEGFSRVYLGQHYPHDILAAAILSAIVMFAGWSLARRPLTRLIATLEVTPLRPLLTGEPVAAPAVATQAFRADAAARIERR